MHLESAYIARLVSKTGVNNIGLILASFFAYQKHILPKDLCCNQIITPIKILSLSINECLILLAVATAKSRKLHSVNLSLYYYSV